MDAYSVAGVLLSSIGMAALVGWLVFGRRDESNESNLSDVQITDLQAQTKSAQNRIDAVDQHLLALAGRLESSLSQLTERITALEADLAATTGLNGKGEIDYLRKELQRLSKSNASIFEELSTILKYINITQRNAEGRAAANDRV